MACSPKSHVWCSLICRPQFDQTTNNKRALLRVRPFSYSRFLKCSSRVWTNLRLVGGRQRPEMPFRVCLVRNRDSGILGTPCHVIRRPGHGACPAPLRLQVALLHVGRGLCSWKITTFGQVLVAFWGHCFPRVREGVQFCAVYSTCPVRPFPYLRFPY